MREVKAWMDSKGVVHATLAACISTQARIDADHRKLELTKDIRMLFHKAFGVGGSIDHKILEVMRKFVEETKPNELLRDSTPLEALVAIQKKWDNGDYERKEEE